MTKLELLNGYKQLGLDLIVIKEEHTELGDAFYIQPSSKISVKDLKSSEEDAKIVLGVKELMITPDYESKAIKIIVGNTNTETTYVSDEDVVVERNTLRIPIGKNITGVIYHSFNDLPHLLIAGSTGSGKSYFLHNILSKIVEYNDYVSIVPIDFKGTELKMYQKFVTPILGKGYGTSLNDALTILNNAVNLMNHRYITFKKQSVSDINEYNTKYGTKMEHIFIVIDELADLMLSYVNTEEEKEKLEAVKFYLISLAQKARGAGIHLILSTQRPTVDVISGHIKANIVSRIALRTSTSLNSKIILDETGAEKLAKGSFLYKNFDSTISGKVFTTNVKDIEKRIASIDYKVSEEYNELNKINTLKPLSKKEETRLGAFLYASSLPLDKKILIIKENLY